MPIPFDIWTFLFQTINVLIVLFVLYRVLYKPVGELMRRREDFVKNTLSEASRAKEEAERLMAEYSAKLEQSKKEAQEIIDRAERTGEEMKQARIKEAREESDRLLRKAKQEILNEQKHAVQAIRAEVANMAVEAAERVLRRSVDEKDHIRVEEEFIHRVGRLR